jgi:hypothetical protein
MDAHRSCAFMERNWLSMCSKNSIRTPPKDDNSHSVLLRPILIILVLCNLNLEILSWFICLAFLIKLLCAFLSLLLRVTPLFYLIVLYLFMLLILGGGPGNSVGIATGYGLNGPGIESRSGSLGCPFQLVQILAGLHDFLDLTLASAIQNGTAT